MKSLSEAAVRQYHDLGYYAPVPRDDPRRGRRAAPQAGGVRGDRRRHAGPVRHKPHLLFTWLNELIRHPRILDAVEDVIGPDILCWGTIFFIKEARNPGYVSWHQDFDLLGPGAGRHHHCLGGVHRQQRGERRDAGDPGTHKLDQAPHRDTFAADNLLSRGQEIMVEVDESQAAMLELAAGEMSLHHVRLIHGSDPNPSDDRRIGFAIRYVPTYVRQVAGSADSATLVRGEDRFGNFELEPRPDADMSPAALAYHAMTTNRYSQILMRGTGAGDAGVADTCHCERSKAISCELARPGDAYLKLSPRTSASAFSP